MEKNNSQTATSSVENNDFEWKIYVTAWCLTDQRISNQKDNNPADNMLPI